MKIIVLGATGQIGSVIYNGLRDKYEVIGTSRKLHLNFIRFDLFRDDWSVLGKADVLINCVGQIEENRTSSFYHIHVELTKYIIENRPRLGNPAIIQISALGASAQHEVEFLRTKGIADDLLLEQADTAVIRPSIICTHRTMIVKKMFMLSHIGSCLCGVVPVPKGFLKTRIQPVMPQDLVDLVAKICVTHQIGIVNAVGPEAISFKEIIHMMMKVRNQSLRLVEVPKKLTDILVKHFVGRVFPATINSQQYRLLFQDNTGDLKIAEEILGRRLVSTRQFFETQFSYAAD